MAEKRHDQPRSPLEALLQAADAPLLRRLVEHVAFGQPELRRQCLDFLSQRLEARPEILLPILLHRGDLEQAVRLLCRQRYPDPSDGHELLQVAAELEEEYPADILAFYLSGLGDLKQTASRAVYARQAVL